MMRKCHLNTCPVGVATQDPVLRKRFKGTPEHVINYFFFVAEEVRELMAEHGLRAASTSWSAAPTCSTSATPSSTGRRRGSTSPSSSTSPSCRRDVAIRHVERQKHPIDNGARPRADRARRAPALETGAPVVIESTIRNVDRTAGAMLSGEVAKRYGHAGLPDDTITVKLTGTAGQSFGAFLAAGVTLELTGQANDYVGKGLSGGS